jgi:hypothetical protein
MSAADRDDDGAADQRAERRGGCGKRRACGEHAAEQVRRAGSLEQLGADRIKRSVDQAANGSARVTRSRSGLAVAAPLPSR